MIIKIHQYHHNVNGVYVLQLENVCTFKVTLYGQTETVLRVLYKVVYILTFVHTEIPCFDRSCDWVN